MGHSWHWMENLRESNWTRTAYTKVDLRDRNYYPIVWRRHSPVGVEGVAFVQ